jgi:hypothetical protein
MAVLFLIRCGVLSFRLYHILQIRSFSSHSVYTKVDSPTVASVYSITV